MDIREELTDFCYRLILTTAIALFLFLEIYNNIDPELIVRKNVISILLISLSFNVLLLIYHKIHLYIIPAILLAGGIFAFLLDEDDLSLILKSMLFKLVIIGLAAFIVFLTSDTSIAVNLILSAGLIIYMVILLIRDMDMYPVSPALAVFYIMFSLTRFVREHRRKTSSVSYSSDPVKSPKSQTNSARLRRYVTYLMPFLLVFPVMIFLLPKPDTPLSWDWAVRIYENAVERINKLSHEISLYFSSSEDDGMTVSFGYTDSMSYDNDSSESTLMEIYSDSRTYSSCYLKGEIFNVFEDGGWKNTLESSRDYSNIDTFETFYGVVNFDRECVNDILKRSDISIKYLDFTTKILFTPSKLLPINQLNPNSPVSTGIGYYTYKAEDEDDIIRTQNEHILFNKRKTYGTEYTLRYYQLNYGSKPFYDFMVSDRDENPDAFNAAKTSYLNFAYSGLRIEDLLEYRNYVNKFYTSKPMVRDSVQNWVNTVTNAAVSDYEKLKAIEYALSTYEYTLDGGELPDYVRSEGDFLNYFLIERKSGYCVHYATAFCLLARYLGYPSRVIQGYKAELTAGEASPVINSDGHTWPEVYFAGKGWIAFEPTPGFGTARYNTWRIYSGKYSEYQEQEISPYMPDANYVPVVAADEDYVKAHSESRVSGMLILIIVSIVVISMILLLVTTLIFSRVKKKKLTSNQLYSLEFRNVLALLNELKISKSKDETLDEFSVKCREKLTRLIHSIKNEEPDPESSRKSTAQAALLTDTINNTKRNTKNLYTIIPRYISVMNTYESLIYGNKSIADGEIDEISGLKEKLLILMKKVYGVTYLIHRMRLYISSSIRT